MRTLLLNKCGGMMKMLPTVGWNISSLRWLVGSFTPRACTQEVLGKALEVSTGTITEWEITGKVPKQALMAICYWTNTKIPDLKLSVEDLKSVEMLERVFNRLVKANKEAKKLYPFILFRQQLQHKKVALGRDITHSELAEVISCPRSMITRYLRDTIPTGKRFQRLTDFLEISPRAIS